MIGSARAPFLTWLRLWAMGVCMLGAISIAIQIDRIPQTVLGTEIQWWLLAAWFATLHGTTRLINFGHIVILPTLVLPVVVGLTGNAPLEVLLSATVGMTAIDAVRYRELWRHPRRQHARVIDVVWLWTLTVAGIAVGAAGLTVVLAALDGQQWLPAVAGAGVGLIVGALTVIERGVRGRDRTAAAVIFGASASVAATAAVAVALVGAVKVFTPEVLAPLIVLCGAGFIGQQIIAADRRRRATLQRLYRITGELTVAGNRTTIAELVLPQTLALARADYAELAIVDDPSLPATVWQAWPGKPITELTDGANLMRSLETNPAHPYQVYPNAHRSRAVLNVRGLASALVVPFAVPGGVCGHLLIGSDCSDHTYSTTELQVFSALASQAGVALRNMQLMQRLHSEARRDELTGLSNRIAFRDDLDVATAELPRRPCALMLMDFDGFKAVNDTLGHSVGDELLREMGRRLAEITRASGSVARLGGDEFAIIASDIADVSAALALAHRVMSIFDQPVHAGGARLLVGGSLGVALGPLHASSGTDLMRCADVAMYAAKADTGGVRVFRPNMLHDSTQSLVLGSDLHEAVERGEISIVVHPIMHLATRQVHSVEVLARWRHPTLGEIPPPVFFQAAEQSGLVPSLSRAVLEQALRATRSWLDAGISMPVAVNVASRWLVDTSLPETVANALKQVGVPADLLCLEITERGVAADQLRVLATLEGLRSIGVRLSIDDFGRGYSSMTFVSKLPVDQLKIDADFVSQLTGSPRDRSVAQSMIDLGRNLGLDVVAEGIRDTSDAQLLAEMGCQLGQGYVFTMPFLPEELPAFMSKYAQRTAPPGPRTPVRLFSETGG